MKVGKSTDCQCGSSHLCISIETTIRAALFLFIARGKGFQIEDGQNREEDRF